MSKWSSAFRDSRWQKKRLEIMERDGWACRSCGASGEGVTLNVHHAYYESNKAPWQYPDDTLLTWCEECHAFRHEQQKNILLGFAYTTHDVFTGLCDILTAKSGFFSYCAVSGIPATELLSIIKRAADMRKKGGAK